MAQENPTHIRLLSPKRVALPPKSNGSANADNVAGLTWFGINLHGTFDISFPHRRKIAKFYQKSHPLALELYEIRIHEERISAAMLAKLQQVRQEQMDSWAGSFDSWDVCDRVFMNLLDKTAYTYAKAIDWSKREETFVEQAVFSLAGEMRTLNSRAAHRNSKDTFRELTQKFFPQKEIADD